LDSFIYYSLAFEGVLINSLPGYCFSDNPTKKGFNLGKMATTFNSLMIALNYPSYVAQGGDWGSLIVRRMGQLHPLNCKAIHVNLLIVTGPPKVSQGPLVWLKWVTMVGPAMVYDKREIEGLKSFQRFRESEEGYQVLYTSPCHSRPSRPCSISSMFPLIYVPSHPHSHATATILSLLHGDLKSFLQFIIFI
jgi:pimeloyl-ACP methyl ester carboxylesterase